METDKRYLTSISIVLFSALILATAVYWQGLDGPFVLDDNANISRNFVNDFNPDEIFYAVTHNESGLLGRPVSMLSLVFTGIVHGPEAWGYKYHNLLLHLINALLIAWLFVRLLPHLDYDGDRKRQMIIAVAIASCWLLHPIMVSTVLYPVQRMAQLSAFFTLAAILFYLVARESVLTHKKRFFIFSYVLFPVSMVLAVFSKENGALIPLYILLLECIVFKFSFTDKRERNRVLFFLILFVGLPVFLGSLYLLINFSELVDFSRRDFTLEQRLLTQVHVVLFYLKLILLPALSQMTLFHDDWTFVQQIDFLTLVLFLLWGAAIVIIFYCRKRAPLVAFGIAWFVISHLMESTIFNLELVYEHRNYLAAVGPLSILFYYLFKAGTGKAMLGTSAVIVLLFSFMTSIRVKEWQSQEILYAVAVQDHPESLRANTLYANMRYQQGNLQEAIPHIDKAIAIDKTETGTILLKILYFCRINNESIAELFEQAKERAAVHVVSPRTFIAIDNLIGEMNKNRCPNIQPQQLIDLIQVAVNQQDTRENRRFLGFLQREMGQLYFLNGNFSAGFEQMIYAYENTGLAGILAELIEIQIRLEQFENAEQLIALLQENEESNMISSETVTIERLKNTLAEARN